MPMPMEYQHASEDFDRFLLTVIDVSGLTTRNQAYTMVQGVLQVFRRRLDVRDAIRFSAVLPPVLRAIFVAEWNLDEPRLEFVSLEAMTVEVKLLRADHNFSPDTAIKDMARALRSHVDQPAFDRILDTLPSGAIAFWHIDQ